MNTKSNFIVQFGENGKFLTKELEKALDFLFILLLRLTLTRILLGNYEMMTETATFRCNNNGMLLSAKKEIVRKVSKPKIIP